MHLSTIFYRQIKKYFIYWNKFMFIIKKTKFKDRDAELDLTRVRTAQFAWMGAHATEILDCIHITNVAACLVLMEIIASSPDRHPRQSSFRSSINAKTWIQIFALFMPHNIYAWIAISLKVHQFRFTVEDLVVTVLKMRSRTLTQQVRTRQM
jgi:hypothetical protein